MSPRRICAFHSPQRTIPPRRATVFFQENFGNRATDRGHYIVYFFEDNVSSKATITVDSLEGATGEASRYVNKEEHHVG